MSENFLLSEKKLADQPLAQPVEEKARPSSPPVPPMSVAGETDNKATAFVRLKTKDDNDCAFHAVLGMWDEREQQVICAEAKQRRVEVKRAIKESKAGSRIRELAVAGIKELIMVGRAMGEGSRQLLQSYQQFLMDQNALSPRLWQVFEAELRKYPHVVDHIASLHQNAKGAVASVREQFYDALNRNDGELYAIIRSLTDLDATFKHYNELAQTTYDWEGAVSSEVIAEYAQFVGQPGQWLLQSEVAILAEVFHITVDYYSAPSAKVEVFNPGQQNRVAMQFNGVNHFEQMRLTPPQVDKKEEKKPEPLSAAAPAFKFAVSFPELEKLTEYLADKEEVRTILSKIQKGMQEIEGFFPIKDQNLYYPEIRARLEAMDRWLEEIPPTPGFHYSIRQQLQTAIQPLQKELHAFFLQEEGVSEAQLVAKTQALYAQQSLITRDKAISKALNNTLKAIQQSLPKACQGLRCFISYAWPTPERQGKEYWLQPFLRGLHGHLTQAGIKPRLDIVDNIAGDNIVTFTNNIKTDEFALLICTESLLDKHNRPQFNVVKTELSLLRDKYDIDVRTGQVRVFPFLVSGNRATATLPEHHLYRTVRDWRVQSYVKNLEQLIGWMCYPQGISDTYQKIWQNFYTQYPALATPMLDGYVNKELTLHWHRREQDNLAREVFYQGLLSQQHQLTSSFFSPVEEEKETKRIGHAHPPTALSYDVPRPIEGFVGRAELLKTLATQFSMPTSSYEETGRMKETKENKSSLAASPRRLILTGLGGVGKTQLALQYAHSAASSYQHQFWFVADSLETLNASYRLFAKDKRLIGDDYVPDNDVIKAVHQWLASQPAWLIIYDNVERYEDVEPYIPTRGAGNILITSRLTDWIGVDVFVVEVETLSPEEAIKLVAQLLKRADPDTPQLTEILGHLPLALVQASAYISHNKISVKSYLETYQEKASYLLKQGNMPRGVSHASVFVTWDINLAEIENEEKSSGKQTSAKKLLELCAYLSPQKIPSQVIETWHKKAYPATLEPFYEAMGRLHAYSLIQLYEDQSIQVHRLVQQVAREQLSTVEQAAQLQQVIEVLTDAYPEEIPGKKADAIRRALVPHLETIIAHADTGHQPEGLLLASALFLLGNVYGEIGHVRKCQELLARVLKIQEACYGVSSWQTANTLHNLAIAEGDLGNISKKYALLERTLKIKEAHYGTDHWQTTKTLINLAITEGRLGNLYKKRDLLNRALKIQEGHYGRDHWQTAATLETLGTVEGELGNVLKGHALLIRALGIEEEHYGRNQWQTATTLVNLANFEGVLGNLSKKCELLERSLAIFEAHYPTGHYHTILTLVKLSQTYQRLKQFEEAKQAAIKAYQMMARCPYYGEDHILAQEEVIPSLTAIPDITLEFLKKSLILGVVPTLRAFEKSPLPEGLRNERGAPQIGPDPVTKNDMAEGLERKSLPLEGTSDKGSDDEWDEESESDELEESDCPFASTQELREQMLPKVSIEQTTGALSSITRLKPRVLDESGTRFASTQEPREQMLPRISSVMDKKETKASRQLSVAAVFKFAISFSELQKVAKRLTDEAAVSAILADIQKEMTEIESFFPIGDPALDYSGIQVKLEAINRSFGEIPDKPGFYHVIRTKIQEAINPLQKEIRAFFNRDDGVSDAQLLAKTQALYAQQALIMRDDAIKKALSETLTVIKAGLPKEQTGMRCFISYAWPLADLQSKEFWLQPFLRVLHGHLKQAGIKPRLDIVDNMAGGNIVTFINNIKTDEFAVLICTESLLIKHEHPQFKVVKMELNLLQQKYDTDVQITSKPRVLPLLVSGSRVTATLPQYNLYSTVRDWRTQSYLKDLEQLIGWICYPQGPPEVYQKIWQDFYAKYPALASPMPEDHVKQELALQWHTLEKEKLEKEAFYQGLLTQHSSFMPSSPEAGEMVASADKAIINKLFKASDQQTSTEEIEQLLHSQLLHERHIEKTTTQLVTRFAIYTAFMNDWFERGINKLHGSADVTINLRHRFESFAHYLAFEMFTHRLVEVNYQPKEILAWESKSTGKDKDMQAAQVIWEKFFSSSDPAFVQARKACPLRRVGDHRYSFIHKSFWEYFIASHILNNIDQSTDDETLTNILRQRTLREEPAVLLFLIDSIQTSESNVRGKRVEKLKQQILLSKGHQGVAQASANAATILNWAGEMLIGQTWAGVQLPGADLSYCVLAHSDLSSANLRGASLGHSVLYYANLTNADLRDVKWGEYPCLQLTYNVYAIAHHPTRPWLAIACGNEIVLVHRDTGERIGETMCEHKGIVKSVVFSPDGTRLVSGSDNNTLRLWDVASQKPWGAVICAHTSTVYSVAFSLDGRYLASGGADNTLRLWDAASQKPLGKELIGHKYAVHNVAFNCDGRMLVSAGGDIRLWEVASQKPWGKVMIGHSEKMVNCVSFSPDGRQIASGGADGTIHLWDTASQELLGVMHGHMGWVNSIAYRPDSTHLASGSNDKTVRLWDAANQTPLGTLGGHGAGVTNVVFSPDGSRLVSGSFDNTVRVWEAVNPMSLSLVMSGHVGRINSIVFSPDGTCIASGGNGSGIENNAIRLWSIKAAQPLSALSLIGHTSDVNCVAYSSNGRYLASGSNDWTTRLWDVASQKPLGVMKGHRHYVTSIAFSPDGTRLASGSYDGIIRLWNVADQRLLGVLEDPLRDEVADPAFNREVRLISIPKRAGYRGVSAGNSVGNSVGNIGFNSDGSRLTSISRDGTIRLWDVARQKLVDKMKSDGGSNAAFSLDGTWLAFGGYGTVHLWDVTRQRSLEKEGAHTGSVESIAFSPDSMRLASGGKDCTVRLWEFAKDRRSISCVAILPWHQPISSVAFAPYGGQSVARSVTETKSHVVGSALAKQIDEAAEDVLAIGDVVGTISFWAVARKDASLRFIGMAKHSGMPLLFHDAQLHGCQMSVMSKRLLEQHGGDVREVVVVDEATHSVSSKLDIKSASDPKTETKATVTRTTASPLQTNPLISAGGPGLFASSVSKTSPVVEPDAKAQHLLTELYTLLNEVYPANDPAVTKQRVGYLARLKPYQDQRSALTTADYEGLRALKGELENARGTLKNKPDCVVL